MNTILQDIKEQIEWANVNLKTPIDNLNSEQIYWLIEQAEKVNRLNIELNKQVSLGYLLEGRVHDLTKENKIYKQTLRDLGDIVTGIPSKMAKDALKRFE